MTRHVRLTEEARRDLEELWWYCFQFEQSLQRADRALDDVQSTLRALAQSPRMGKRRSWLSEGQLAFRSKNYMVVYRESEDGIEVVAVTNSHLTLRGGR